jgi:cytochrome b6-f complex iron-sulfur subunit
MNAMPSNANPLVSNKRQPEVQLSRRSFLALAGKSLLAVCGLLVLGELLQYLGYQTEPSAPTQFDLGPAGNYPPGSRTLLPQAQAVLLHTEAGFTALSLVCPHLGCTVKPSEGGYACPCHGSRFNQDGSLRNGPASQPMKVLKVEETSGGRLILYN